MHDFLLHIDNKEILIEILHHSIDYLIGNRDDQHTLRMCHKYGFNSPDDFMLTTRTIARSYRNCCTEGGSEAELLSEFANLSPELQRLVPNVLVARKAEVMRYLLRCQNAQEHTLVESFDWDMRLIMGDSSYAQNRQQIVSVTFDCRQPTSRNSTIHFQMNCSQLEQFIAALEEAIKATAKNQDEKCIQEKKEEIKSKN